MSDVTAFHTAQAWADSLTDAALVDRLRRSADDIRFCSPVERRALMREAAMRLAAYSEAAGKRS